LEKERLRGKREGGGIQGEVKKKGNPYTKEVMLVNKAQEDGKGSKKDYLGRSVEKKGTLEASDGYQKGKLGKVPQKIFKKEGETAGINRRGNRSGSQNHTGYA